MRVFDNPDKELWKELCERPLINNSKLDKSIIPILEKVKKEGDSALREYTALFDAQHIEDVLVGEEELLNAKKLINKELKEAIMLAADNIRIFHASQKTMSNRIETTEGVSCWQESRAIEKVGLYIPGGSAPLFSTVLMLAIPASIAGCSEIILASPPYKNGKIHPAILFSAALCGVTKVVKAGGAQAIAGMAYGTESIPAVNKIFGPGNQYVTRAKELVQLDGRAIDMPAGPSEVLIIADKTANPQFIAADLLSQAEHGADSQVMLLSNNMQILERTIVEISKQTMLLPRSEIAGRALENSKTILLESIEKCIEFSNLYAPEHLILNINKADQYINLIGSAGSVFIGSYSCESAGDYASGTNHTLPTNGYARSFSGVTLNSFLKSISFQEISPQGLLNIGPAIEIMAESEDLMAHKNAVSIRLKSLI